MWAGDWSQGPKRRAHVFPDVSQRQHDEKNNLKPRSAFGKKIASPCHLSSHAAATLARHEHDPVVTRLVSFDFRTLAGRAGQQQVDATCIALSFRAG